MVTRPRSAWAASLSAALVAAGALPPQDAPAQAGPPLDARAAYIEGLRTQLSEDVYFKTIELVFDESHAPLVVALQKPFKADPGWEAAASRFYGPWAKGVIAQFERRFAEPLKLARQPDRQVDCLIVLATQGDFVNMARVRRGGSNEDLGAYFDSELGAVICDPQRSAGAAPVERQPVLREVVRSLLQAYSSAPPNAPKPLWMSYGLTHFLTWNRGETPADLDKPGVDRKVLEHVTDLLAEPSFGPVWLLPPGEAAAITDMSVLSGHIRARAQALGLPVPSEADVRDSFARQAGLWWTYLLEGEGGRWQERSRVYVANAMAGRPERERLAQVFAGTELADLERGYLAWAHRTRLALQPWWPCPPEAIDKLFVQRQLGNARLPAPVPGQVGAALAHEDAELRHALALAVVRRGDLARAMAILEPLAEREDDFGLRIKSEIERVRALAALRDTFLGGLARDGGRLKFERGERAMNAKVVRVEPEHVVVTTARGGEELVPIAELRSFDLVRQIGRQADAEGTDWVRAYPYVLEGDERWESMLREPGEPGLRLRADAKAWYPALLGLCSAAETVNALETEPAPQDAASAAATMKAIESLLATHAAHPAVRKRRAALRSLATTCFNLSHADEDPCAGLHAKVARAEDGRVRLLYEFDDAAELEDFHSGPGYPKGHVASVPPLETNGAAWKPRGGSLRGAGDASWRHVLPFEGPILVRLRLSIDGASRGGRGSCMWIVGACDDGLGSYYAVRDLGSVYAADISSGSQAMDQVDGIGKHLSTDVTYALDLDFDGERLSSVMNGVTVKELSTKVRTSGDVFLTVNSDALILIESLEIVGTPSVAARRTRRLGERLAELGLLDD